MSRTSVLALSVVSLAVWLSGCAGPVVLKTEDAAGCEAPSADNLVPEAPMLPGRHCMGCHKDGGDSRYTWTAAGTVFGSLNSSCNTGGLDGVRVDIVDETNRLLITLTTNRAGNFYTSENLNFTRIKAKVSKGGKSKVMNSVQPNADCPSCHYPGGSAGGRIYLD